MKLKVIMKSNGTGGLTPLLCDEHGEPLPGQVRVDILTAVDDIARCVVEFCMIEFAVDAQPAEQ